MQTPRMRNLLRLKFVSKPKADSIHRSANPIDALGWLIDIADTIQSASAAAPFPQIQGAVAALSVLLKCIQKVYRNNEEYEELLARIKSILEVIRKVVNEADKTMCARMSDMLMEFEASLRDIVRTINSQRQRNDKWIKQLLHSHSVSDSILRLKIKFDDARLNVLVTATFVHHSSMKDQVSKLDQKLEEGIASQASGAVEAKSTLSRLQQQSQELHTETQAQSFLMSKNQTDLMAAFTMQSQHIRDGLHAQDKLALQHHLQTTGDLSKHQAWLQTTLQHQNQLVIRQHDEVLNAVKRTMPSPLSSPNNIDEFEEYEENFQVFKQSEWKPKQILLSSDEEEGSWMSPDSQVLVIDQASVVRNVKYRVRTFKAAANDKPEQKDAAFEAFKNHLQFYSSARMPFLPELVGFSKFKHGPSLFFEEHDEEYVPWPDYQYDNELARTLILFKVNLVEEDARKYMARHMGMHPARNKEGNRIAESVLIGPGGKVKLLGWTSVTRPRVDFTSAAVSLKLIDQDLNLVAARLKRLENRQQVLRDFVASGAAFLKIKRRRVSEDPLTDYHSHLGFLYCTCCSGPLSVRARWTPHIHFTVTATYEDETSTATALDITMKPKSHRLHCAKVSINPGITLISSILFPQSYEPVDISIMYHASANPHHISFEHLSEYSNRYNIQYYPNLNNDENTAQLYLLIHPGLNQYGKPFFEVHFQFEGQNGMSVSEAEAKGIFVEQESEQCLFRDFSAGQEHFPLLCEHMELDPFKEYYPQALEEQGVSAFDDHHPDLELRKEDQEYGHPSHPTAQDESTAYYFTK
ncbi:MAG: hypothetical protein NXY57DRAFT_334607 [Lentinula lateritia]|nr:MAG: hypothetical protein NXY57DRAFT_334607 [Lentinula lateritia]